MPLTPEQLNIAYQGLSRWLKSQGTNIQPEQVEGFKRAIQSNPEFWDMLGKGTGVGAGAGTAAGVTSALPLIGAGALATGAWAYPAKKLGEEIGWRIEEKKAGKRLRPASPSFKEYGKYLPGEIAHTITQPGRWVNAKILSAIQKRIKKKK